MFNSKSTNVDITQHDWAHRDRAAMLRSMHARPTQRSKGVARSVWGTDVAGSDRRSVHAYLSGKGDLRAAWWNIFSEAYMIVLSGATLERRMYAFHRAHHSLTFMKLDFAYAVVLTAADIEKRGILAATHGLVIREWNADEK